jgi:hypothetical protein
MPLIALPLVPQVDPSRDRRSYYCHDRDAAGNAGGDEGRIGHRERPLCPAGLAPAGERAPAGHDVGQALVSQHRDGLPDRLDVQASLLHQAGQRR